LYYKSFKQPENEYPKICRNKENIDKDLEVNRLQNADMESTLVTPTLSFIIIPRSKLITSTKIY